MITEKEINQAEKNVALYLQDGLLKRDASTVQFFSFYLNNAKISLLLAEHIYKISTKMQARKAAGFSQDYECLLWVVVISYYSMFYTANAALSKMGLKVSDKIPHKVTQDSLIVYFLKSGRLAKSLLEDYKATQTEVMGIMNANEEDLLKEFQVKATELIATFDYQRKKRGEFQYQINTTVKEHVATLSLERAKTFIQEMNRVIETLR